MTLYAGNLVGQTGSDGTTATGVAANYLKAATGFTNFGTRQLQIINVAQTGIDTTPTAINSLFSKTVRALQQNAEIYAVGTPTTGNCQFIIAVDTLWDGQVSQASFISDASYDKFEAAILAGSGVAATVTSVAL
jgi:hypothetical protein